MPPTPPPFPPLFILLLSVPLIFYPTLSLVFVAADAPLAAEGAALSKEVNESLRLFDWYGAIHGPGWCHLARAVAFPLSFVCLVPMSFLRHRYDGPLVEAMRQGDMFLIDEISLADDSVLERLNRCAVLQMHARQVKHVCNCGPGGLTL